MARVSTVPLTLPSDPVHLNPSLGRSSSPAPADRYRSSSKLELRAAAVGGPWAVTIFSGAHLVHHLPALCSPQPADPGADSRRRRWAALGGARTIWAARGGCLVGEEQLIA